MEVRKFPRKFSMYFKGKLYETTASYGDAPEKITMAIKDTIDNISDVPVMDDAVKMTAKHPGPYGDTKMQKSEKEFKAEETTGICKTCEYPIELPDALACYNCWEVEHRLEVYLKSSKGRAFVADALMNATKAAITQAREKKDG